MDAQACMCVLVCLINLNKQVSGFKLSDDRLIGSKSTSNDQLMAHMPIRVPVGNEIHDCSLRSLTYLTRLCEFAEKRVEMQRPCWSRCYPL